MVRGSGTGSGMSAYRALYTRGLGRMDAEAAHRKALQALALAQRTAPGRATLRTLGAGEAVATDPRLAQEVWGLPFSNPLGVAAGLDKNADAVLALGSLGFGHVEVGTVTLQPQPGNARPRLWRVPEHDAVINAMGFPSAGAAAVRQHLLRALRAAGTADVGDGVDAAGRRRCVIGVNLGKNRETPLESAVNDYTALVAALSDVADYITVNVSSPNTPGLRTLQLQDDLRALLAAAQEANRHTAALHGRAPRPLLVKIAPDLTDDEVAAAAEAAVGAGADGVIATNTTTQRSALPKQYRDLPGGLSGPPLTAQANHVVQVLYRTLGTRLPIVGVGGISSAEDALERIRSGATLVQVYTAFIWQGPGLAGSILRGLLADAEREGWTSVRELIGSGVRA